MTVENAMLMALKIAIHDLDNYKRISDWTEDAAYDDGTALNTCVNCGVQFAGHPRRCLCKFCATAAEPNKGK